MRNQLLKSMDYIETLEMMYIDQNRIVSKRKILVLQVGDVSFRAYCYLRKSKRTFKIDNVLALVPVMTKEKVM